MRLAIALCSAHDLHFTIGREEQLAHKLSLTKPENNAKTAGLKHNLLQQYSPTRAKRASTQSSPICCSNRNNDRATSPLKSAFGFHKSRPAADMDPRSQMVPEPRLAWDHCGAILTPHGFPKNRKSNMDPQIDPEWSVWAETWST